MFGYDPEPWGMSTGSQTLSTVIRDDTPGGFAMPNSIYLLQSRPSSGGINGLGLILRRNTLPAKA
jgi:hypothetical protein